MKAIKVTMMFALVFFFSFTEPAHLAAPVTKIRAEVKSAVFPLTLQVKQAADADNRVPGLSPSSIPKDIGTNPHSVTVMNNEPIRNAKIPLTDMQRALRDVRRNAAEARAELRWIRNRY